MMNHCLLRWGLLLCALCLWPTTIWAGPLPQGDGTVPTVTATANPPIDVVIEGFYTLPQIVVAGDVFDLNARYRNAGQIPLFNIAVTITDVQADWALTALAGDKTSYQADLTPGSTTTDSRRFLYTATTTGNRELAFRIAYTYQQNEQVLTGEVVKHVTLAVAAPTPTPTLTATPTSSPTATPTLSPIVPPTPVEIVVVVATQPPPAEPTGENPRPSGDNAEPPADTTGNGVSPARPGMGPSSPGGPGDASNEVPMDASLIVLLEFTTPIMVQPGQLFLMDMTVRNLSALTLTQVVLEWQGCAQPVIAPTGGGQWYFTEPIAAQGNATIRQQFFVVESAPDEAQECAVQATFAQEGRRGQQEGAVYLWVQEGALLPMATATASPTPTPMSTSVPTAAPDAEPLWLRLLRFLIGR